MATRDPRIDAYILEAPAFAQPILEAIRDAVHAACPEVVESIKWSRPFFEYRGPLCNMSAFKAHAAFGFWKGALIPGLQPSAMAGGEAMGHFGKLTSVKDLPGKKVLAGHIKAAMKLNAEGVVARPRRAPQHQAEVPEALAAALRKNRKARAAFDAFTPGQQRAYATWIAEGKREPTRAKRVAEAVAWIAEGKSRNWKYERS
jgi:hypothetical protein